MRFVLSILLGLVMVSYPASARDAAIPAKPLADDLVYRFDSCVFNGGQFPHGAFEQDKLVQQALGPVQVATTFYDAQFRAVTQASADGRYGAVVRATFPDGTKMTRFITLYRAPQKMSWRLARLHLSMTLPPEWGIDPGVVKAKPETLETGVRDILGESQRHNEGLAVWLAALSEMKGDTTPDVQRTGMYVRDNEWWWELKKHIGLGQPYPHLVYLPDGYADDATRKWPLVLFLHGSGERGESLPKINAQGLPKLIAHGMKYPAIIVSPQCEANGWWSAPELMQLLDDVCAKYRVDPDRISVTGLSMGGFGTWQLALLHPERFSAIAPICGGGDPADAARLTKLPTWAFHGGKDETVPVQLTQNMVQALQAAGGHPHLTIFPNDGHDSWTDAYQTPLIAWLIAQKRGETAEVGP